MCRESNWSYPSVVFSEADVALDAAITNEFPKSLQLWCIWYIHVKAEGMLLHPHYLLSEEDERTIYSLQSKTQATLKPELLLSETIAYCDGSYNPNIKQGASGFYIQDIPRRSSLSGGTRYSNLVFANRAKLITFCRTTKP